MEKEQDPIQPDKTTEEAKTVGEFLRYTRLSQKKTIEGVAKALCIRKMYIKAIEENNFKELPPVPYGTGFVRSYAGLLGLNVERIVQCYKEEAMPQKHLNKMVVTSHDDTARPNRYQILFGLVILVLLYALWFFYKHHMQQPVIANDGLTSVEQIIEDTAPINELDVMKINELEVMNEFQETIPEMMEDSLTEKTITEPKLEQDQDLKKKSEPQEEQKPQETQESEIKKGLVVKFTGESWIEIRDDQKVYVTGTYDKGFEYKIPEQKGLIFSVGRQGNVEVYRDGELIQITRPQKQTGISLDEFINH